MSHPLLVFLGILCVIGIAVAPLSDAIITWFIVMVLVSIPIAMIFWGTVGW